MVVITMEACIVMKRNKLQPQAAIWITHQQNAELKDQTEKSMCTSDGFKQSKN